MKNLASGVEKCHLWNVATTQAALDLIAETLAIPEPALARFARALKEAADADGKRRDLWPLGRVGGGRGAAHVHGPHLANLILAMFAQQPSDAVAVVDELSGWVKGPDVDAEGKVRPSCDTGYATLGEFVLLPIEALARADDATRTAWAANMGGLRLCVDLDGGLAFVMDRTDPRNPKHWPGEIFHRPGKNPFDDEGSEVNRIVEVPLRLLVVAASLLTNTLAKRGGLDFTSSGEASAEAQPENENAAIPGRTAANTRTTDRLRDNGNRTLHTRQSKAEISKPQALSLSRGRAALNTLRSAARNAHQHDFLLDPPAGAAGRPAAVR